MSHRQRLVTLTLALTIILSTTLIVFKLSAQTTSELIEFQKCVTHRSAYDSRECYSNAFEKANLKTGEQLEYYVEKLLHDPITNNHFGLECHAVLHILGEKHAANNKVAEPFPKSNSCIIGYVHGVLLNELKDTKEYETIEATKKLCPNGIHLHICIHYTGHVIWEKEPAGHKNIERALSSCGADKITLEKLPAEAAYDFNIFENHPVEAEILACAEGVFMERVLDKTTATPFKEITLHTIFNECVLPDNFHPAFDVLCLKYVGVLLYYASGYDFTKIVSACNTIKSYDIADGKQNCLFAAGSFIEASAYDLDTKLELCLTGDSIGDSWCASGLDYASKSNNGSDYPSKACERLAQGDKDCILRSFPKHGAQDALKWLNSSTPN